MKKKERKHKIEIRGIIPLFFRKYYFVILVGRDTREEVQAQEAERRAFVRRVNNIMAAAFLLSFTALFLFFMLYYLKSALGIDIFPDRHLWDFLGFLDF